jgi:hypothetical protein
MTTAIERIGEDWRFPKWEQVDDDQWEFTQDGKIVGEAYLMSGGEHIKWHCKTSDWRDTNALSIEQAKAECEASFWKEEWQQLRDVVRGRTA